MDLSARTVRQSNDRANRRLAHQSRRLPVPLRAVWVAVVTLLLAVALWLGMTTRGGATLVRPTAAPTALATAAPSGGSAAQATPTDQQRASWYLQQQDSEQDYCQCGR
jgi:hypothetical protein